MFDKYTTFSVAQKDIEVMDSDLIKTAALKLPDGIQYDPDFLYLKVRGVSAGEYFGANKNNDYFPEAELKKSYKTFLNAHAFKNHENKDIANAIGDVLATEWDDEMKGVMLTIRIDRRIAPTVVRGFEKGFMTDVSMGCRVDHVVCSYCGQKAKTQREYCEHLRMLKGKTFDNGVKVYEINIGPKFHDISAVLNGAEKVAKVSGLYIHNNKIAFRSDEARIEKISQMNFDVGMEKAAAESIDDSIFEFDHLSKRAWQEKIADIKKEIQSKILSISKNNLLADHSENGDTDRALFKLMGETYWNDEQCAQIAAKVQKIAQKHRISPSVAFQQFLKILDFAGIELSPKEFAAIGKPFTGIYSESKGYNSIQDPKSFMNSVDKTVNNLSMPRMNFSELFESIYKNFLPNVRQIAPSILGSENPVVRTKIIIAKMRPAQTANVGNSAQNDLMSVVGPMMPQRSMFPRHFTARIQKMAHTNNGAEHYASLVGCENPQNVQDLEILAQSILYAAYQDQRELNIGSEEYFDALQKFASLIEGASIDNIMNDIAFEKVANDKKHRYPLKAHLMSIPLIYGYSGYQRARINQGENVSNINRYFAENPDHAVIIQAMIAPKIYKGGTKVADAVLKKSKSFLNKAVDATIKSAHQIYNGDIFKDAEFDAAVSDKYNANEISALKMATIFYYQGNQTKAEEALFKVALPTNEIDNYLQSASDYLKIKVDNSLDKIASMKELPSDIVSLKVLKQAHKIINQ